MATVLANRLLAPRLHRLTIESPRVARKRQAGQFVIVRLGDGHERIPLTIAAADPLRGSIDLVIQAVGVSTSALCAVPVGGEIADVCGPLGQPTHLLERGHAVCVGGGVGTAVVLPIAKALRSRGVHVTSVVGGRTRELLICLDELAACGPLLLATDDGSAGRQGLVTTVLAELIRSQPIDRVYAVGPVPMMRAVAELTLTVQLPTIVSLNPIMIDGTGMCGGCRVQVGGQARFACVDGPEFDAHQVDFAVLVSRQRAYHDQERRPHARAPVPDHPCRIGLHDQPAATCP